MTTPIPPDWTPHRRDDGELVGWIYPDGEFWAASDLLGWPVVADAEWLDAEAALEDRGISWLAEVWMLDDPNGSSRRVRIVDVRPGNVVVHTDDFGSIDVPSERIELAWPAPATLRPRKPGEAQEFGPS